MALEKAVKWLGILILVVDYSVSLQWYNSGPQSAKVNSPVLLQWHYKLTASEQQQAKDFSMLLWERETALDSNEWITVAAFHPSSGKKITTDSSIALGSNLTLHINSLETVYFSRFRCTFVSSFSSASSDLILKEDASSKNIRVRLAGGSSPNQGRVELYYQGAWGTVCHNGWDAKDATVICGMLGYPLGSSFCCASYGQGSGTIWLDDVSCQGNESSILDCKYSQFGVNNCTHVFDAGVYCYGPTPAGALTTPTVTITTAPVFRVRLANGSYQNQGRVEVLYGGTWGTVCHNHWDARNAKVVCNMLGYPLGYPYCCGHYGHGSGPIWMDKVFCNGTEKSLSMCKHAGWQNNSCDHSMDAGVYCYFPLPTVEMSTVVTPTETTVPTPPATCPPQPTVHVTTGINCTFDGGLCGWTAIDPFQEGMTKWMRYSGSTPTEGTGPDSDHTSRCGSYMLMEATGRNKSDSAILASPSLSANGKLSCFSFYYHMNGSGMGRMAVALGQNLLWSTNGSKGNKWNLMSITMTITANAQIYIFGAIGSNDRSDIAIDDISFINGSPCPKGVNSSAVTLPPALSGQCSFDSGWCGWTNIQGDQFDWTRNNGGTPTSGTGPSADHTSGTGWYVYLETSAPRVQGDIARLVSPVLKAGNSCMTFYYHMFDKEKDSNKPFLGQLKIKIGDKSLWQTVGNHGNKWYKGMVSLSSKSPFQVNLEGTCGSNVWSDIAVDDIDFLQDTQCPLEANCTFEEGYCGWSNEDGDKLDWGRNYGATLSSKTGPSFDHTLQTEEGYYIFIETSKRTPGDNARLLSPDLHPSTKCMTFYYHMFGATVSTLTVEAGGLVLLKLSGNQGDAWYKATIPLEFSNFFQVTIEGNVGSSFTGDIAVDDIVFTNNKCQLTAASQIPAQVTHISSNITVKAGDQLKLICLVKGSFDVPTYVAWIKDGGSPLQNDTIRRNYTVSKVDVNDAGAYACVASNDYGRDQKEIFVDVQYGPRNTVLFTDVPHNVAEIGEKVAISCLTEGNPNPSCILVIQRPDHSVHQVSTSLPGVHVISSYNADQHLGNYGCRCYNSISTQDRFFVLSTYVTPKIDGIFPESQDIDETEAIKLFCNVTGNPSPNVTWTKVEDPARVFPSGSNLVITKSSKKDAGTYKCTANNGRGFAIRYANVSLKRTVPQIVTRPENATMYENSLATVTFTCNATGTPEPLLIWKKQGMGFVLSRGKQLVLSNVTRNDHGVYQCIANNGFGGDVSTSALLNVLYKPTFTKLESDNVNPVVVGNGRILLICKSDANPPANNYSFFFNNICIGKSDTGEFLISQAKRSDQGTYSCQAKNKLGIGESATVNLTVYEPLEIVAPPQNETIEEGNSIAMSCNASSSLPVKIAWEKAGSEGKVLSGGNLLSMKNVSRSDAGIYRCKAENGIAFPAFASATINVLYKPREVKVVLRTNLGVLRLNDSVFIDCSVDANPTPNVFSFYVNDSLIQSGPANVYTIRSLKTSHIGVYSCVASNAVGVGPKTSTFLEIGGKVKGNFTKCYKTNITAFYKIPGGVTLNRQRTLPIVFTVLKVLYAGIAFSPNCIRARMSGYQEYHSTPGVDDVYVRLEIKISAKDTVPTDEVASGTSSCAEYLNKLKPELTAKLPPMILNGSIYRGHNISISDKKSCCGSLAPPCCTTPKSHLSFSYCESPVSVRLVGGLSANEGRVEIYHQGVWGTVCGSNWDTNDAHVVCRMLGFISAKEAKCCSVHGKGMGQIWLRNVSCNGSETSLDNCPHGGWGGNTCDHSQDASVVCSPNRTNTAPTTIPSPTTRASGENIKDAPVIIQRPKDLVLNLGENATFTCNASGVPRPTIVWTKSGEDKIYSQNETLEIMHVNQTDEGKYRCEAIGDKGNRAVAFAVLRILRPPSNTRIKTNNVNPVVLGNGQITLLCTADAYPSLQYSFYKGNRLLVVSPSGKFAITKAKASNEGTYKCIANNSLGRDESSSINLKVYGALSLDSRPTNKTVDEGTTVSLFCNSTSALPARIAWERLGGSTRQLPYGETLQLINVLRSDEGTYRCVAANGLAYRETAVATLTVRYKPQHTRLVAVPDDLVALNGSVSLRCTAEANPLIKSFKFYHNRTLIQHSSSNLYRIIRMSESQQGLYSCVPVNALGEGQNTTFKIKVGVPCGVRHLVPTSKSRIAGGTAADPGSHPWQAQISRKSKHVCGGSILTSRFIVSAAHCFAPSNGFNYTVTLGEHTLSKSDGHEQKIEVEKIIRHENYSYTDDSVDYDIALLKLKEPVKLNGLRTAPACVIESNFSAGTLCTITGWGQLSYKGANPDVLQEAKVKLVSKESCHTIFGSDITPRMICAGGDGVTDACQGDSGGPLMCERDHKFYLTGLTSWGIGCAQKGKPGVYANILDLKDWIKENISNNI